MDLAQLKNVSLKRAQYFQIRKNCHLVLLVTHCTSGLFALGQEVEGEKKDIKENGHCFADQSQVSFLFFMLTMFGKNNRVSPLTGTQCYTLTWHSPILPVRPGLRGGDLRRWVVYQLGKATHLIKQLHLSFSEGSSDLISSAKVQNQAHFLQLNATIQTS